MAAANPNTIVVLNTGSAVTMPWLSSVKGVLEAWYPGQEDGTAIASLLFGNDRPVRPPDRHLPDLAVAGPGQHHRAVAGHRTAPCSTPRASTSATAGTTAQNLTPLFPFGYGLSYTTFSFSNLQRRRR